MAKKIIKKGVVALASHVPGLCKIRQFTRWGDTGFSVIAYHRVKNMGSVNARFDDALINATCEEFDRQIKYLNKNYSIISSKELTNYLVDNQKLPKGIMVITFDDGFDDNYHNAFPILKDNNVPATFFISAGLIGQRDTFWFEKVHYYISATLMNEIPDIDEGTLIVTEDRKMLINNLTEKLKLVDDSKRTEYIRKLANVSNVEIGDAELVDSKPMNWAHIKEMTESGMQIGSHSCNHPILSRLDDESLNKELSESKTIIENKINTSVDVIAYPNGNDAAVGYRVQRAAEAAGYKLGMMYGIDGYNSLSNTNKFSIKRLGILNTHNNRLYNVAVNYPRLVF